MSRRVLIVGAGSAGRRHGANLRELGCRVAVVDPRPDRRAEAATAVDPDAAFATLESALADGGRFDGAVIASPTASHVDQAVAVLRAGLPVLLEKPVSTDAAAARRLRAEAAAAGRPVLLGYTWRWWPPLARVRTLLAAEVVGPVRFVHFHMSAHLADWHPWERYQDFFMASKAEGGGALLDESHWLDLMVWLFGLPARVVGRVGRLSSLDIETDDCVDVLADYPGGPRVSVHLDLIGRPHEKSIRFVGEHGTVLWTAEPNAIRVGHAMEPEWTTETFTCQRNDMFVAVAREFVDVMTGAAPRTCTLDDGLAVMELIEAVRAGSELGVTPGIAPGSGA